MNSYECKVCHNVIPPEASFCEFCETGFAVANEKWVDRAKDNFEKTERDDYLEQHRDEDSYIGEKL